MTANKFLGLFESGHSPFGTLQQTAGSSGLPEPGEDDLNGYVAMYGGGEPIEVWAVDQYSARQQAAKMLNVPQGKEHMVSTQIRVKKGTGGVELPPEAPMM